MTLSFGPIAKKVEETAVDLGKIAVADVAAVAKVAEPAVSFVKKEAATVAPKIVAAGRVTLGAAEKVVPAAGAVVGVAAGIGGLALKVASPIAGLFSGFTVSWKWISVAIILLTIGGGIFAGYEFVHHLTEEIATAKADAAQETLLRTAAEARANAIQAEHDDQVDRINTLETQRSQIASEVTNLRQQMQDLNTEQDIKNVNVQKADSAVAALSARNAQLNRLLVGASGGQGEVRSDAGRGSQAGKTGALNTLQRALQTLR